MKTRGSNYRLKYYDFWFLGKNILSVIYPWANFPGRGGNFPWGHFAKGQLCRQQIIQKTTFLGGNFQGDVVRGKLYLG